MKNLTLEEMKQLAETLAAGRSSTSVEGVNSTYEWIKKELEEEEGRLKIIYSYRNKLFDDEYTKLLEFEAESVKISLRACKEILCTVKCMDLEDIILEDFKERLEKLLSSYGYEPEEEEK